MQAPEYRLRHIGSLNALARALGVSERRLDWVARTAHEHYLANKPQPKPTGETRQTYKVVPPLKCVQKKIHSQILQRVRFPKYLFAVKNDEYSHDYIADASEHAGCRALISIDIRNFYPSIKSPLVRNVWQYFFNFPPEVADILTRLTIYRNSLPQGASTSAYLSVLVLFNDEPRLEEHLRDFGFKYSRYVDDIYVSASRSFTPDEKHHIVSSVVAMLYRHGLRPKRRKLTVRNAASAMTVHKLNLNSGRPTKSKAARYRVRAAVRQCEISWPRAGSTNDYRDFWRSTQGRVLEIGRLHDFDELLTRLYEVRPTGKE